MGFEVTSWESIQELPLSAHRLEEPCQVELQATADDGDVISMQWDEMACTFSVTWRSASRTLVEIYRECITKISFNRAGGVTYVSVTSVGTEERGDLLLSIGESVVVSDAYLRVN